MVDGELPSEMPLLGDTVPSIDELMVAEGEHHVPAHLLDRVACN